MIASAILTGLLLITTPAFAEDTLYERVQEVTERQFGESADPEVNDFVRALMEEEIPDITAEDVDAFLRGDYQRVCHAQKATYAACQQWLLEVRDAVERERDIRTLGRKLYMAAAAHEIPLGEHLMTTVGIGPQLQSILNIWQAGTDALRTPRIEVHTRMVSLEEPHQRIDTLYADLRSLLRKLAPGDGTHRRLEDLAVVVARYRYGVRAVQRVEGEDCTADDENPFLYTELERLGKRYCDIERTLKDIWDELMSHVSQLDPPLRPDEHAVFETEILEDLNIAVWANDMDIGVIWEFPTEPVLPMLTRKDTRETACADALDNEHYCKELAERGTVPGGLYPDPPEDPDPESGLCAQLHGKEGYLCRTQTHPDCMELQDIPEEDLPEATSGKIILTECRTPPMSGAIIVRSHGPDICGIGSWRLPEGKPPNDTPQRDKEIVPGPCADCAVDLYCSDSDCPLGGYTFPKEANGVIPVCINKHMDHGSIGMARYLIIHEMAHAQQVCRNPETHTNAPCCAVEYEAYSVMCNAMAEDGLLEGIPYDNRDISVSVELCASLLSNGSCRTEDNPLPCSDPPGIALDNFVQGLMTKMQDEAERLALPKSCEEAIEERDPRVMRMKAALLNACTPECQTRYPNTIGNNLCFIGQCIEQGIEQQRMVPGRTPYTTQDSAFPWDACYLPDSTADPEDPMVTPLILSTRSTPPLPVYNPEGLLQRMDLALCQLYGMPPQGLPTLCQSDLRRRMDLTLADWLEMSASIETLVGTQLQPARELERLAAGIGSRVGGNFYIQVLGPIQKNIADLFSTTATFLEKIAQTQYPDQMCSRTKDSCPYR